MLLLAGCADSAGASWQRIDGMGFHFEAPQAWTVAQQGTAISAAHGKVDLVQVQTFRLRRVYRSTLFAAAARELDGRVGQLARLQHGHLESRATISLSAGDARSYRIVYGSLVEQIAFVLVGRREYELLCRRAASEPDATCARFVAEFRIG